MQTWAQRSMQTALIAGGLMMVGAGIASAAEYCPARPTTPLGGSIAAPEDAACHAVGTPLGQIHQLRSAHPLVRVIGFANRLPDPAVPGARPPIATPAESPTLPELPKLDDLPTAPPVAQRIDPSEWPTALLPRIVDEPLAPSWVQTPGGPRAAAPDLRLIPRLDSASGGRLPWITGGQPVPPARSAAPVALAQQAPARPMDLPPAAVVTPAVLPLDHGMLSAQTVQFPRIDVTGLVPEAPAPAEAPSFFGGPIVPSGSPVRGVALPQLSPAGPAAAAVPQLAPLPRRAAAPVAGPLDATGPIGPLSALTDTMPLAAVPAQLAPGVQSAPAAGGVPARSADPALISRVLTAALSKAGAGTPLAQATPAQRGDLRPRLYPVPPALANVLLTAVPPTVAPTEDETTPVPVRVRGEGLPGPALLPALPQYQLLQASLAPPVLPTGGSGRASAGRVALPPVTRVVLPEIPVVGQVAVPLPPNPSDLPKVQLPVVGGAQVPGVPNLPAAMPAALPVRSAARFPEITAALLDAQRSLESTATREIALPGPATLPSFPELGGLRHRLASAIPTSGPRGRSGKPSVALPVLPAAFASPADAPTQVLPRFSVSLPTVDHSQPNLQQNHLGPLAMR